MDLGSDIMVDESNIEISGEDSTDNVAETEEFDAVSYTHLRAHET